MATVKNYIVTDLPDYVDQTRDELIAKSVIGAKSAGLFRLFTGVKGATALNLIDTKVTFGNGAECGWDDAGDVTLSQRVLDPAYLKVNLSICDKNLLKKWANYLVRIEANKTDRDLPFEKELVDGVIADVNAQVEKMIWNGTKSANSFSGIMTEAGGATRTDPEADVYEAVKKGIAKLPAGVFGHDDLVVFIGADKYQELMMQLVEKNLYHYDPKNGEDGMYFPGTSVKMIAVPGLNGNSATGYPAAVIGRQSNFVYGTNMEDGTEVFDLWYSKDNREFRLAIEFTAGVQVAYPDEIVIVQFG